MGDSGLQKRAKKPQEEAEDGISLLPDEILTRILLSLTLKEAGRTSVLSKRWELSWTYVPELDFDASTALAAMAAATRWDYREELKRVRSKFINWVHKVMESHDRQTLAELSRFRICIYMDYSFQNVLNKWLQYAIDRRVQRLEVNLLQHGGAGEFTGHYLFHFWFVEHRSLDCLKVLILKGVQICGSDLECFLHKCRFLETLVVHQCWVDSFTLEVSSNPSLALRHLEICKCHPLTSVMVRNAANLVSLKISRPDVLVLENDPRIVDLHFCSFPVNVEGFPWGFSCCISRLEVLSVYLVPRQIWDFRAGGIQLSSLKQLSVMLGLYYEESMAQLAAFFEAAPNLEKFALKLPYPCRKIIASSRKSEIAVNYSVLCLKVVEIHGYHGRTIELSLAKWFLKNAVSLEKLTLDPRYKRKNHEGEPSLQGAGLLSVEDAITRDGRRRAKKQLLGLIPSRVTLRIL